jgi:threonine synthase
MNAFKNCVKDIQPVNNPETVATAIRIGFPVSWKKALKAVYESKGLMETVSDEEILEAQRLLAQTEGLFVEPASATSIAGLKQLVEMDLIAASERVVCVATGCGLKDPDIVIATHEKPIDVDLNEESLERVLEW